MMKFRSGGNQRGKEAEEQLPSLISADVYRTLNKESKRLYRPIPRRYEFLPPVCLVLYAVATVCMILLIIQSESVAFSDWFNMHISAPLRALLAALTAPFPFSVGELTILLLPPALIFTIRYAVRHRCDSWRTAGVFIGILLSVLLSIFSLFVLNFSAGYRNSTLDVKLGLEREEVSAEELAETAEMLVRRLNEEADNLTFERDGFSVMPYSLAEMNDRLSAAYDTFCNSHDFIRDNAGQPKPVLISEVLSYMHITGVYSFFTGEANINVNFPDYTIPYTAAHEMAHQRGIAREDEANMVAFLVCIESDDPYIRYSAYLNMYEYVANALYSADASKYRDVRSSLNSATRSELSAYSSFYQKYRNSTASKVSGVVNNSYLHTQQVSSGTKSYGMVVDLTVAWYKAESGKN
jgi:hypothetical protein